MFKAPDIKILKYTSLISEDRTDIYYPTSIASFYKPDSIFRKVLI